MAVGTILRAIKQAVWVGWKVETNWADPLVFAIYYMIRPVAGLLIVGFMFLVGSLATPGASLDPSLFAYIFVGNSFFLYAVQIMTTMSMLIHEDRAHYEVLKHIYLAPGSLWWYIFGRALNGVMNASISLLLTLGFGVLIFQGLMGIQIPINWLGINVPLLAFSLVFGIICFIALGFVLSGVNIMTSKVQFMLTEYVSGILYLFCGVVFTPAILPSWGQAFSSVLPVTYFLRVVRFAVVGQTGFSLQTDLLYLVLTTAATVVVGVGVFKFSMHEARRKGLIDRKEEY
ncbi:MAG TPA: ABC transporter permease [Candidatus Bathyarchaeia archaeon]|jgi:ABC-2 type transport system permease protein|nr:ABC transporter permease [Candidatus Bathyarchaeia archaeon]